MKIRHICYALLLAGVGLGLAFHTLLSPVQASNNPSTESRSTLSQRKNQQFAPLIIEKFAPAQVAAGSQFAYTIVITNQSDSQIISLIITDKVPTGTTYVRGGAYNGREILWQHESLSVGESAQFSYTVQTGSLPIITNQGYEAFGFMLGEGPIAATGPNVTTRLADLVTVVDEFQKPVPNAQIMHNGQFVMDGNRPKLTDANGQMIIPGLATFDALIALQPAYTQPTDKTKHDLPDSEGVDVAFRVYRTSMAMGLDGDELFPQRYFVSAFSANHVLQIQPQNTLVLFNIVASIGWDADEKYISQVMAGLKSASDLLYDTTNGQMAFGWVTVYDNGEQWLDADIHFRVSNHVRPHAYIGGISPKLAPDKITYKGVNPEAARIVLGRYWNGKTGHLGPWDQPEGYKTIAHEFGHYALFLFDEYFGLKDVNAQDEARFYEAQCAINGLPISPFASLMYYQYDRPELCSDKSHYLLSNPPRQLQVYGDDEHSWLTIKGVYSDHLQLSHTVTISPWQILEPADYSRDYLIGPLNVPFNLPQPINVDQNTGAFDTAIEARFEDKVISQTQVSLHRADGAILDQGLTDSNGQIEVLGAHENDIIRVRFSANRYHYELNGQSLVGSLTGLNPSSQVIELEPAPGAPVITATSRPGGIDYYLSNTGRLDNAQAYLFDAPTPPIQTANVTCREQHKACVVSFDYVAKTVTSLSFWLTDTTRSDLVSGPGFVEAGGGNKESYANFINDKEATFFSDDGNIIVTLNKEDFAGPDPMPYLKIQTTNALPGPPPLNATVIGLAYSIEISGTPNTQTRRAVQPLNGTLTMGYHTLSLGGTTNPDTGGQDGGIPEKEINQYRWDEGSRLWVQHDSDQVLSRFRTEIYDEISAPLSQTGIYILMTPGEPIPRLPSYLPIVVK